MTLNAQIVLVVVNALAHRTLHGTKYRTTATPQARCMPRPSERRHSHTKGGNNLLHRPALPRRAASHVTSQPSQQQPLIVERADKEREAKEAQKESRGESNNKFAERGRENKAQRGESNNEVERTGPIDRGQRKLPRKDNEAPRLPYFITRRRVHFYGWFCRPSSIETRRAKRK